MFNDLHSGYYISDYAEEGVERVTNHYELELCTTDNSQSLFDEHLYNRINGSIFLAKPGQKRKNIHYFETHYVHFKCEDPEFQRKYLDTLPTQIFSIDTYKCTQSLKEIHFLHQGLKSDCQEENKLLLDAKITVLMLELYNTAKAQFLSEENSRYVSNITTACRYIAEHFQENIGIDEISGAAMLSQSFTYVMFKKVTGMTPHAYLTNTRIHYACEQLIYTAKSVAQISLDCGFSNEYYLNQIFARYTGMTPGKYRRSYRKKMN